MQLKTLNDEDYDSDDDEETNIDEEKANALKEKKAIQLQTYTAMAGTSIHHFIKPEPGNYSQDELCTFYQHYQQYYMSIVFN